MNDIIYLEPDDDIANVIGRIKESDSLAVSLVVPRGGTIAQSVVNLKLLKREIEKLGKYVSLVTADKISKNLASQVGVTVYPNVNEAKSASVPSGPPKIGAEEGAFATEAAATGSPGIRVNRYNKEDEVAGTPDETEDSSPKESKTEEKPIFDKRAIIPGQKEETDHNPEIRNDQREKISHSKESRKFSSPYKHNVSSRKKPLIIIISASVILALILAYVFVPYTKASLILKTEDTKKDIELTIDKNAGQTAVDSSVDKIAIVGEEITATDEMTKEGNSTGKKNVGEKARGEITFYNYWDVNPQAIPAGTTLTASGKNFTLEGAITIPGATVTLAGGVIKKSPGTVKGKIVANDSGEAYNIPPSKFIFSGFSGGKQEEVYGESTANLSGGTTKEMQVVTADNISRVKAEGEKELIDKIKQKLASEAEKKNKKIIDSASESELISSESSKKAGDESATFSIKIKEKVTTLAYSDKDLRQAINDKIAVSLGSDKMIVNSDKANIAFDNISYSAKEGKIKLTAKYEGKFGKKLDVGSIKSGVKNKKFGDAKKYLETLDGVQSVDLKVWPTPIIPVTFMTSRISINFDYNK